MKTAYFPFAILLSIAVNLLIYSSRPRQSIGMQEAGFHSNATEECVLTAIPAWDDDIRVVLDPQYNPTKWCTSHPPRTRLTNGRILPVNSRDNIDDCMARELHHAGGFDLLTTEWAHISSNTTFASDVVEVKCGLLREHLHNAVFRNVTKDPVEQHAQKGTQPNLYIILVDSISNSAALRSFPHTLKYLESAFQAINMPYLNRVGDNSRPNGFALLLGKLIDPIHREVYNLSTIETDPEDFCGSYLPDDSFILSKFHEHGYRSLTDEDWPGGIFVWPDCKGFQKQPTTHINTAFASRRHLSDAIVKEYLGINDNCKETYKYLFEYANSFIDAYPDKPKVALLWAAFLAHNDPNAAFHADDDIRVFFERNFEEFDNSFVFFISDHGLRFGKITDTDIGRMDTNNPMLWVSIPNSLRESTPIRSNLRANSEKLLTMFDIHATFVDILESLAPPNVAVPDFSKTILKDGERGQSILRPLPDTNRTRSTLPIPFQYSICQQHRTALEDRHENWKMGTVAVEVMNQMLTENAECYQLTLRKVASAIFIREFDAFEVIYSTMPGAGSFRAIIRRAEHGGYAAVASSVERLNRYGFDGTCAGKESRLSLMCYCKHRPRKPSFVIYISSIVILALTATVFSCRNSTFRK